MNYNYFFIHPATYKYDSIKKNYLLNFIFPKGPQGPGLRAIVRLIQDQESGVEGELVFTQILANGPVTIEGNVTGLSPGLHGLHVHQAGAIKDNCKEIGPHFIAYYVSKKTYISWCIIFIFIQENI